MGVFGWLQADTVAAVWTAAAAIHREKNTVEAAAAAELQPQQAAANKLYGVSMQVHTTLAPRLTVRTLIACPIGTGGCYYYYFNISIN
jgi:hypothetical protein